MWKGVEKTKLLIKVTKKGVHILGFWTKTNLFLNLWENKSKMIQNVDQNG
jgi:hypothetical protein